MSAVDIHSGKKYIIHPKKMVIWLVMVSVVMIFAALSSYLIVRKSEGNWMDIQVPEGFKISTIVIILSSITYIIGQSLYKKGQRWLSFSLVAITLALGYTFMYFQNEAFREMLDKGLKLADNTSVDIIYVFVWAHITHIVVALLYLVSLLFVIAFPKYTDSVKRRFENAGTFWHFLGLLWIYLYVFLLVNYNL